MGLWKEVLYFTARENQEMNSVRERTVRGEVSRSWVKQTRDLAEGKER